MHPGRFILLHLALILLASGCSGESNERAIEEELKQLEGDWVMVAVEFDGKKEDLTKEIDREGLRFKGKTWEGWHETKKKQKLDDEPKEKGTFTIDPTRKPRWKDVTAGVGAMKGKTFEIIYEIEGDVMRESLFESPDKGRPTAFTTKQGSGQRIFTFRRVKR